MRGIIGGCGCFVMATVIAVTAFALGTAYGPRVKKVITKRSYSIVKSAKKRFRKISAQIKSAQDAAGSLSAEEKEKKEAEEREKKRQNDINFSQKSIFDIERL